jgi:hypothetical protein
MDPRFNDAMSLYQQIIAQQQGGTPQFTPQQLEALMGERRQRASMLPLAIGASLAGDRKISAIGQALYKDATEAQGNMQLGNEGWLTPDGQMIANPFTQYERQQARQDRALNLALQLSKGKEAPAGYAWVTDANGQKTLRAIPGGPADPSQKDLNTAAPAGYRWIQGEGGQRTLQVIPGGPEDPNVKNSNLNPPSGYQWVTGEDGQRTLKSIPGGPGDPTVKDENAPPPAGYRWVNGADGSRTLTAIPGGPGDPVVKKEGQEPTEDEKKSAGYALRIQQGLDTIKRLTEEDPSVAKPEVLARALTNVPFVGEGLSNFATTSKRQQVEAAQLDMLDAALTLNTGAAYTREQLQGLSKSYFPQIGDSDATIAGKKARLDDLINTARMRAGRMDAKSQSLVGGNQERKVINGKTYVRRGGQWFEE